MSEPRHLSATDDGFAAHARGGSASDAADRSPVGVRAGEPGPATGPVAPHANTIAPPPLAGVGLPSGPVAAAPSAEVPATGPSAPERPGGHESGPSTRRVSRRQARRAARARLEAARSGQVAAAAASRTAAVGEAAGAAAPLGPSPASEATSATASTSPQAGLPVSYGSSATGSPIGAPPDATVAGGASSAYSDEDVSTSTTSVSYRGDTGWTTQTGQLSGGVPVAARARSAARPAPRPQGPRQARLRLRRVDPWSVLKFSFVLGLVLFAVWMIVIGVLYGVLSGSGVFDKVNSTVNEINGGSGRVVTPQLVLGAAAVVGAVEVVLFTAVATVGSFIYNLCADVVGGVEITFGERD